MKYPKNENPNVLGAINTDIMYENVMEKWSWGNMDDVENGIYMDEDNRRMVTNVRLQMSNLAESLLKENQPQKAMAVLDEMVRATPKENVPYSRVMMPVAETYLQLASNEEVAPMTRSFGRRPRTCVVDGIGCHQPLHGHAGGPSRLLHVVGFRVLCGREARPAVRPSDWGPSWSG